ncbi:DASH family cryptochrome [Roseivirga sp. BDSF3-8]|uniref:DASH family cryptochrome n=1 Tax=Roseivirga sp. BDSF3-8 TaxID=3241598 RepID=UPI0035326210
MSRKRTIFWLRNDLRLHDNHALVTALEKADEIVPVYCFDPRHYHTTSIDYPKTGSYRAQFLLETLTNLRDNFRKRGGDIIIRQGLPEKIIPDLAEQYEAREVVASKEVTTEEVKVEDKLEKALYAKGKSFTMVWQSTLLHVDDIPWPVRNLPDTFTDFRKESERSVEVRDLLPVPDTLPVPPDLVPGEIPHLEDLGLEETAIDERGVLHYKGGEDEGLKRLQAYIWEKDCLKSYKETRNGMLGADYSSKFSAWLANGSISPRKIYAEVKRYEEERRSNQSTYWMIFELRWRDYFRFVAKKYGNLLFVKGGPKQKTLEMNNDEEKFKCWAEGRTGIPFIDANMKEIALTGYMSNRGRQNVASFLVKDLKVNWIWGASYFESMLIDYDPCSNWGNWCYVAGVGNDPRENRYFNIMSQANRYDGKGEYVKHWLPELEPLPASAVHHPGYLREKELAGYGIRLPEDYPEPVVDFDKWL